MEVINKKSLTLTIVAVVTLIALVAGATYAYFAVGTTNNFGTTTINANAGSIGTVTLAGANANLTMSLSATDMMKGANDITYYASSDGKTTTATEEIIGIASVSPNTDTNYYECSYTLNVTHTGTKDMYNWFNAKTGENYNYTNRSTGQIILTINGADYDFTGNWPSVINGTFSVKAGSPVNITAGLRLVNSSEIDQTYLAGTDINVSISVAENSLSCTATEEPTSWVYYGWDTNGNACNPSDYTTSEGCTSTSPTFDGARGSHLTALRSVTGVKYSGIAIDDVVQACGLINGSMYCVDYFDSSRGDGTSSSDGSVRCYVDSGTAAGCDDDSTSAFCGVFSDGRAFCFG